MSAFRTPLATSSKYTSTVHQWTGNVCATAGQGSRIIPPNKKTYQQDPGNYREALREARLDEAEGADIMMVKPGLPYLDVIRLLRDNTTLPIAAYHVSGVPSNPGNADATCQSGAVSLELDCAALDGLLHYPAMTCYIAARRNSME